MIVVKLCGGLGNQMFEYAFSRALQEYYKEPIWLSIYELKKNESGSTKREYALNCFELSKNVRTLNEKESTIFEFLYRIRDSKREDKVIKQEDFERYSKKGLYRLDAMFQYYKCIMSKKKIKFVDGLFMSEKYFRGIESKIKKEFCFKIEPSEENRKMIRIIKSENAVCVHIRRGDYLSSGFKKTNYICEESYYQRAMQKISSISKNPIFYIFSTSLTDIKWIKKNYDFTNYEVKYVELENTDYEELRLMKSCKHFILANSSFSWWAQYLCEYKEKIVVAPSKWLRVSKKEEKMIKDIYMNNWEIIEVS